LAVWLTLARNCPFAEIESDFLKESLRFESFWEKIGKNFGTNAPLFHMTVGKSPYQCTLSKYIKA
jgi:hypothetical protein